MFRTYLSGLTREVRFDFSFSLNAIINVHTYRSTSSTKTFHYNRHIFKTPRHRTQPFKRTVAWSIMYRFVGRYIANYQSGVQAWNFFPSNCDLFLSFWAELKNNKYNMLADLFFYNMSLRSRKTRNSFLLSHRVLFDLFCERTEKGWHKYPTHLNSDR